MICGKKDGQDIFVISLCKKILFNTLFFTLFMKMEAKK